MKRLLQLSIVVVVLLFGISSCNSETNTTKDITLTDVNSVSVSTFITGETINGLELAIRYQNDSLEISLTNISDTTINACSHINTFDLDWYTILLTDQKGNERTLFIGEPIRTGSQMHTETLMPSESFSHKIDLAYWALQEINNQDNIVPGIYSVTVSYEANDCYYPSKDYWNGKIIAGPIEIEIN